MHLHDQKPTVIPNALPASDKFYIRGATATESDAQAFAKFALYAAHDIFSHLFGNFGAELMRRLYLFENNHFSYDKTAFITVNEHIAGAISGYTHQQKQATDDRTTLLLLRILKWRMIRALVVDFFYTLYGLRMGNTRPGDYYIQIVAIEPDFRGQGLSYRLLEHAEKIAIEQNCSALTLDVAADNPVAIHAYQNFGFEISAKSPRRKPVVYQMRKAI